MKRIFADYLRVRRIAVMSAAAVLVIWGTAASASDHAPAEHAPAEHESAEGGAHATADLESSGVKLGEFKVRTDYPVEAQKCTVRFILYASVDEERLAQLRQLVAKHEQKVRDNVIIATRLAPLNVFQEPDLAKFRRRILIRLRRNLPELALGDLYISDFGLLVRTL